MATTTTITKLLFRRGNDEDREQTILASGEPGWVLDTKRLWVGDGTTAGGYPIPAVGSENASSGKHLWYVDYELPYNLENQELQPIIGQGQQFLDVNVPGLSQTLAGKQIFPDTGKWFHPARDDITTNFDIVFETDNGRNDAEIRHTGNGELKIWSSAGGNVNINNSLFIRGDGTIVFESDEFIIKADRQIFDEGNMTHFEDKSIDFNVVREITGTNPDGSPIYEDLQEGVKGATAEKTGIYFAHENYLSAGHVSVGHKNSFTSWGTIEINPPVYTFDWEEMQNVTGRGANGDYTNDFRTNKSESEDLTGWRAFERKGVGNASGRDTDNGDYRAKPLIMHSLRPSSLSDLGDDVPNFRGFAHLMFESGLLVYDDASKKINEQDVRALGVGKPYNAYRINQSVDSRAAPVFSGLKIRAEDGVSSGEPFDVQSGGTGTDKFNKASIIHTIGTPGSTGDAKYTSESLVSTELDHGEILVGTSSGLQNWTITSNNYLMVRNDVADQPLRIDNTFAPDYLENNQELRTKWFVSFGTITTDEDNVVPVGTSTEPKETLNFNGDWEVHPTNTSLVVDNGSIYVDGSNTGKKIDFHHRPVGTHLYEHGYDNSKRRGSQDPNPGEELTVQYGHLEETGLKTRTRLVYAGDTSADLETAIEGNSLYIDVTGGADDTIDTISPLIYKNQGYAFGALRINEDGHLVGFRSKNFDDRYMLGFNVGTQSKRSGGAYLAPTDISVFENQVTTGADWAEKILSYRLDNTGNEGSIPWLSTYFNAAAQDTEDGNVKIDFQTMLGGVDNLGVARDSIAYKDPASNNYRPMHVVTGLVFNDYGTVKSYDTHNLTDTYYDKQQIGWMGLYLDTRVAALSAEVQDIDYFSTWEDSATVDKDQGNKSREIRSTWRNNSSIHFTADSAVASSPTSRAGDVLAGTYMRVNPTDDGSVKWFEMVAGNNDKLVIRPQRTANKGLQIMARPDTNERLVHAYSEDEVIGTGENALALAGTRFRVSSSMVVENHVLFAVSSSLDSNNRVSEISFMREPFSGGEAGTNQNDPALSTKMFRIDHTGMHPGDGFNAYDIDDDLYKDNLTDVNYFGTAEYAEQVWVKDIGHADEEFGEELAVSNLAAGDQDTYMYLTFTPKAKDYTYNNPKTSTGNRDNATGQKLYTDNTVPQNWAYNSGSAGVEERRSLKYNVSHGELNVPNLKIYGLNRMDSDTTTVDEFVGGNIVAEGSTTFGTIEGQHQHTFTGDVTINCDPENSSATDPQHVGMIINGNVEISSAPADSKTTTDSQGYELIAPRIDALRVEVEDQLDVETGGVLKIADLTQNGGMFYDSHVKSTGSMSDGQLMIGKTGGNPSNASITTDGYLTMTAGANSIQLSHTGSEPHLWGDENKAFVDKTSAWVKTGGAVVDRVNLDSQGHVTSIAWSELTRNTLEIDTDDAVQFATLGVGTAAPNAASSKGKIHALDDIIAFYQASDQRLKQDICQIDDALEIVNSLRGVRFKYNDTAAEINPNVSRDTQVGVIAQEVEQHLPEVIKQGPTDEYKGIRYENITAVLIEAVKTLSSRVEELEKQINC
jgi:hypothetical protein